jgi:DedD protein
MEQQLKERLVGASVLVAIGMLVIPALLDGPDPAASVRIGLEPSGRGGDAKTHQIRLNVPKEQREGPSPRRVALAGPEPNSSADRPSQDPPAPRPVLDQPEPAPAERAPAPQERAQLVAPAPSPGSGSWAVQVGSFSKADNAERLAADLRRQGFDVSVTKIGGSNGPMHRVRVGPVDGREDAEALAVRLQAAGQHGRVVRNEG